MLLNTTTENIRFKQLSNKTYNSDKWLEFLVICWLKLWVIVVVQRWMWRWVKCVVRWDKMSSGCFCPSSINPVLTLHTSSSGSTSVSPLLEPLYKIQVTAECRLVCYGTVWCVW